MDLRRLGRYQLISEIGRGGMGIVYRARDERLGRDVAVKILPQGALSDASARKRFRQEATLVSRVNHPNIETIHDFDTDGGVDFLVMELIPGEGLDERVSRGPLAEKEVIELGFQLANGLAAAHTRNLVHRDLKPGNLRITPDGRLKILDFGLAKLLHDGPGVAAPLTRTAALLSIEGALAGTLPYMSPEQLRGEAVDGRTDVYAAGVVLYELATGRRPFTGSTQAELIGAILSRAPVPASKLNHRLSARLDRVLSKAMEKDPAQRFQTAHDLGLELGAIGTQGPSPIRSGRRLRLGRTGSVLVGLAALVLAGWLLPWILPKNDVTSLAVLPFGYEVVDSLGTYLGDGIAESLIHRFSRMPSLGKVIAFGSASRFRNLDPLEAGRALEVEAVLIGTWKEQAGIWSLRAEMVRVENGAHLWGGQFSGSQAELVGLEETLALEISRSLGLRVNGDREADLVRRETEDDLAYREYLRGKYHLNRFEPTGWWEALRHFQAAVERDPTYAQAYAGMANTYAAMSSMVLPPREAMTRSRFAAGRALEIDPRQAEALAARAYAAAFYDWDWTLAESEFREAIRLEPGNAIAHANLGYLLAVNRRFEEAEDEFRTAWDLDPLSPLVNAMTLWPLNMSGRHEEVVDAARRLLEADPDNVRARLILGQALVSSGRHPEGLVELETVARALDEHPGVLAWVARAHALIGNADSVLVVRDRVDRLSQEGYVQPYFRAALAVVLGDTDQAFDWLIRSLEERSEEIVFLPTDAIMDPLRSDPRYPALVRRVGLEP